MSKQEFKEFR